MISIAVLSSCSGSEQGNSPEDDVREFGKRFVDKLNEGQLDSVKGSYADIVKADSLVTFESDTIIVSERAPGEFDVTLNDGITLDVRRGADGLITVRSSKGLFAYPDSLMGVARFTGMLDDILTDAQLAERMGDREFFKYVEKVVGQRSSQILMVTRETIDDMQQHIINNTDQPVSGNDYVILRKERGGYYDDEIGDYKMYARHYTVKGRDIPPHGRIQEPSSIGGFVTSADDYVTGFRWTLAPEELQSKFSIFTGTEYRDYLSSQPKKQ